MSDYSKPKFGLAFQSPWDVLTVKASVDRPEFTGTAAMKYERKKLVQSRVIAKARAEGKSVDVYGRSREAQEYARKFKLAREQKIIALKPLSDFNAPIATAAQSMRSNSIGGKL